MEYSTLTNKLTKNDDIEMIDLLSETFRIPSVYSYSVVEVTDDYVARPDIISQVMYGTDIYTDIICKVNGISNPFNLNKGMYLIIPDMSDLQYFVLKPEKSNNKSVNDKRIQNNIKKKEKPKQPNIQEQNKKNFKIDKNNRIVIY